MNVLRWIIIVPGPFLAAVVAVYVMRFIFWFGGLLLFGGESLWETILNMGFENFAYGFVFVFAAGYIAPSHKAIVILVAIGIHILLTGAGLFIAITHRDYWSIYKLIVALIGAVIAGVYFMNSRLSLKGNNQEIGGAS